MLAPPVKEIFFNSDSKYDCLQSSDRNLLKVVFVRFTIDNRLRWKLQWNCVSSLIIFRNPPIFSVNILRSSLSFITMIFALVLYDKNLSIYHHSPLQMFSKFKATFNHYVYRYISNIVLQSL